MRVTKIAWFSIFYFITFAVQAEVFAPDPTKSNQVLWDTILGYGSFSEWQTVLRGVPLSGVFLFAGWVTVGLYQCIFVKATVDMVDGFLYFFRLLLLLIISVSFITM